MKNMIIKIQEKIINFLNQLILYFTEIQKTLSLKPSKEYNQKK